MLPSIRPSGCVGLSVLGASSRRRRSVAHSVVSLGCPCSVGELALREEEAGRLRLHLQGWKNKMEQYGYAWKAHSLGGVGLARAPRPTSTTMEEQYSAHLQHALQPHSTSDHPRRAAAKPLGSKAQHSMVQRGTAQHATA